MEGLDEVDIYKNGVSRDEARIKLTKSVGGQDRSMTLRNNDGEEVQLSNRSVGKMLSGAASGKSVSNGFTKEQHFAVAANIDDAFRNSIKLLEHPDKNGHPDIIIHRFGAPLHFRDAIAYITIKESAQHGKKMYSIELMEIGKLGSTLEKAIKLCRTPPHTSIIERLGGALEEVGGSSRTHFPTPSQDMAERRTSTGAVNSLRDPTSLPRLYDNNIRKLFDAVNTHDKKR